ncbi:MAG: hypothetical protein ACE5K0_05540 [Candidatus Methanofastidiosia archaeon]
MKEITSPYEKNPGKGEVLLQMMLILFLSLSMNPFVGRMDKKYYDVDNELRKTFLMQVSNIRKLDEKYDVGPSKTS